MLLAGFREEHLEVLGDQPIEQRFFGTTPGVRTPGAARLGRHRGLKASTRAAHIPWKPLRSEAAAKETATPGANPSFGR